MTKLFITDPRQLLLAVAQVIEDHPERHTIELYARDKTGEWVLPESNEACSFCALGLMRRLRTEGTTDRRTEALAAGIFKQRHGLYLGVANDDKSRPMFVRMLREAAA